MTHEIIFLSMIVFLCIYSFIYLFIILLFIIHLFIYLFIYNTKLAIRAMQCFVEVSHAFLHII